MIQGRIGYCLNKHGFSVESSLQSVHPIHFCGTNQLVGSRVEFKRDLDAENVQPALE